MVLLDGKALSNKIINKIKGKIAVEKLKINFAIIWIGNDKASEIYVNNKIEKCSQVGINPLLYHLDEDIKEKDLINLITKLNKNKKISGILIQSPLPKHIDASKCFNLVDYKKDIDGFSEISVGKLRLNNPYHIPCTAKGIIKLLDEYKIDLEGKNVCIINRSNIVGKPLSQLFIQRNATVTICHSHTKKLENITKSADIIVTAVGKPKFITSDMVKEDVIVIDVGISRVDGKVIGDVDFESVSKKSSYITPVPGGVGPMTIAMVIENIYNTKKEN